MISAAKAPRWLMIANAFQAATFGTPVLMLYYGYKGVTMGDFFLIQGIAWMFVFFLEIPSGYVGDLFSRKRTVAFGFAIWIIGYLCWIFGYGFWCLLGGELLFGIATSLVSGTIEAYLYDLLKKRHKENIFHKKLSKLETIANVGLIISTASGAFIYQYIGPEAPMWISICCVCICVSILFFLPDVPESKRHVAEGKTKMQDIWEISKYAVKHTQIKWLMFFPAIYGTLTLILMWGLQAVMITQQLPVFMFSVIMGIRSCVRLLSSFFAGHFLEKYNLSGVIKLLTFIMVPACLASIAAVYVPVWFCYVCLFLMIMGSSSYILAKIVTSTLVNHRVQSDERATVLSVKSMVDRSIDGISLIALKPLFDTIGVGPTFMISSLFLIPILYLAYKIYKMHMTITLKPTV